MSYDLNYRALLWKNRGGLEKAQEIMNELCKYVDVLVGNEEELQKALGIEGADVSRTCTVGVMNNNVFPRVGSSHADALRASLCRCQVETHSKLDPGAFFGMIDLVTERFPQVKVVCCTLREVVHTNKHNWSSVAWINGALLRTKTSCTLGSTCSD